MSGMEGDLCRVTLALGTCRFPGHIVYIYTTGKRWSSLGVLGLSPNRRSFEPGSEFPGGSWCQAERLCAGRGRDLQARAFKLQAEAFRLQAGCAICRQGHIDCRQGHSHCRQEIQSAGRACNLQAEVLNLQAGHAICRQGH